MANLTIVKTDSILLGNGATLINLTDEEQTVVASILIADPKTAHLSVRKDGKLTPAGTFLIADMTNALQMALEGDRCPPPISVQPLS
jgi:hypothetical protein